MLNVYEHVFLIVFFSNDMDPIYCNALCNSILCWATARSIAKFTILKDMFEIKVYLKNWHLIKKMEKTTATFKAIFCSNPFNCKSFTNLTDN